MPPTVRLIPAHAGKTLWGRFPPPVLPAHPRSRGENVGVPLSYWTSHGSSPLTRGKHHRLVLIAHSPGLIPAHAGKTRGRRGRSRGRAAHPRSRGENAHPEPVDCPEVGSSPLTRGKPIAVIRVHLEYRLIPAHAGKTHM